MVSQGLSYSTFTKTLVILVSFPALTLKVKTQRGHCFGVLFIFVFLLLLKVVEQRLLVRGGVYYWEC